MSIDFTTIGIFILFPILLILTGSFFLTMYKDINNMKKRLFPQSLGQQYTEWGKAMTTRPLPSEYIPGLMQKVVPIIYLTSAIVLSWVIPIGFYAPLGSSFFSLILVLVFFMLPPVFKSFMALTSTHDQNLLISKHEIKKLTSYFLPILLGIISLYLIVDAYVPGGDHLLNLNALIQFQTSRVLIFENFELPALFLFLNPFAGLAMGTAIVGYTRDTTLDIEPDEEQIRYWNPEDEFTGYKWLFVQFQKSVEFFLILALPVALFLGAGQFTNNESLNFSINIGLILLVLLIVAFAGRGKPRTWLDRTILHFIRTPLFFSLLGVAYSFFIINYNLPFVVLV